jgi:hypothetical protein
LTQARPRGQLGLLAVVLVLAALAGVGLLSTFGGDEPEVLTLEERYLRDTRISILIYDCQFGKQFDADTTDMTRILVAKLEKGERDPLHRARMELARIGADAVPDLQLLFDEVYGDPWRHGVVENILGVCTLMDGDFGLGMLREGLQHPKEGVRLAALNGISKQGNAGDYDAVLHWMTWASSPESRSRFARTLEQLDPPRYYRDFADWLEQGRFMDVWNEVAPRLTNATEPDVVARYRRAADEQRVALTAHPFLIAPAARDGDETAMALLDARLESEHLGTIQYGLEALARIGQGKKAYPVYLREHERVGLRKRAMEILAEMEPDDEVDEYLRTGLSDPSLEVQVVCLGALVGRADELGVNTALSWVQTSNVRRERAIACLSDAWETNPETPYLAFEALRKFYARAASMQERVTILQMIGRVPLREAAEFLMGVVDELEGPIKSLTPHRFCAGQVFNTGPDGRALLRERLAVEDDPFRRLDLIEYIWQDHSDEARETLVAVFEDEGRTPFERLYATDRAIQIGPASALASRVKRTYMNSTDPVLRPALQCLLWRWYGLHY